MCDVCRSSETTQACKQGRSATIRLRCNPTMTAKDHIMLPRYLSLWPSSTIDLTTVIQATFDLTHTHTVLQLSSLNLNCGQSGKACNNDSYLVFLHSNCSEGTCDGCIFHFLWESQHACPLCTKNHYREIVSACIQGIQVVLHRHGHIDQNNCTSSTSQIHHRSITNSCCMEKHT